jgi:hypothetical protein
MANPSTVNARSIFMSLTPVAFNLFSLCYAVVTGKIERKKKQSLLLRTGAKSRKKRERGQIDIPNNNMTMRIVFPYITFRCRSH